MVQYIHTPWRDRAELLKVRSQFYPTAPSPPTGNATSTTFSTLSISGGTDGIESEDEAERQQQHAVSRVAMWMQRGSCPHMVESTGLLAAAILDDVREARSSRNSSTSAVRLAYSAAFSRFVTGLLDSHQDKQQKQSMYSIAKIIGLPATFVELRHQCTHEQLPSLLKLRSAAHKSLAWIWDYYWKNLLEEEAVDDRDGSAANRCKELLLTYLGTEDAARRKPLEKRLKQWDDAELLQTLTDIEESTGDPRVLLQALQLSQQILDGKMGLSVTSRPEEGQSATTTDVEMIQADIDRANSELTALETSKKTQVQEESVSTSTETKGWSRYKGTWTPKPIGVV